MEAAEIEAKSDSGLGTVTFTRKGLSCRVDRSIPLFTEVVVSVSLPSSPSRKKVSCRGVVVACTAAEDGGYTLLLYFLDLDDESCGELAPYCSPS